MKDILSDLDSSDDDMDSIVYVFDSNSKIDSKYKESSKPDKTDCTKSSDGSVVFIKVVPQVVSNKNR